MTATVNKSESTSLSFEPRPFRQRFAVLLCKISAIGFIIFEMQSMIPKMTLLGRCITIGFGLLLIGNVLILGNRIFMAFSRTIGFFFGSHKKEHKSSNIRVPSFIKKVVLEQPGSLKQNPPPIPPKPRFLSTKRNFPLTPPVINIIKASGACDSENSS